jgi:hypothetical protein
MEVDQRATLEEADRGRSPTDSQERAEEHEHLHQKSLTTDAARLHGAVPLRRPTGLRGAASAKEAPMDLDMKDLPAGVESSDARDAEPAESRRPSTRR